MEKKRLCRSMGDKAICGVCSGFARYFNVDPIIIRLVVVLLALTGTIGIWFYIIAAIVMPKDTDLFAQSSYRYDPQTGRPLYHDGTYTYENHASTAAYSGGAENAGFSSASAQGPVNVEFTAEPYEAAPQETPAEGFGEAAGSFAQAGENPAQAGDAFTRTGENPNPADISGEYKPEEGVRPEQFGAEQAQNPYENFQAYNTAPPQKRKTGSRNRNTGILLIVVGAVILAKVILPKINMWIPVSIASIFFGIFLLCRKD